MHIHIRKKSMRAVRLFTAAFLSLVAAQAVSADEFDKARLAYQKGDYAVAHDQLLAASRKGDAQAQELLGMMHMVGPQIFPGVPQDLTQAAVLLERAANKGRPAARAMYCALARRGTLHVARNTQCFDVPSMASVAGPR
jgi:TPR repeat protein